MFISDFVNENDFYRKPATARKSEVQEPTSDSFVVQTIEKVQGLDTLAIVYFTSILAVIVSIHLLFSLKKRVSIYYGRYERYRIDKKASDDDDDERQKQQRKNVENDMQKNAVTRTATDSPLKQFNDFVFQQSSLSSKKKTTNDSEETKGTSTPQTSSPLRKLNFGETYAVNDKSNSNGTNAAERQQPLMHTLGNLFPDPNYVGFLTNADKTYTTVLMKDQMMGRKERVFKVVPDSVANIIKTKVLSDPRDYPLVEALASISVYLPLSIFILVTLINVDELKNRKRDHLCGFIWLFVTRKLFSEQFMSILKRFSKYEVFKLKSKFRLLNRVPSVLLAPAFGVPSGVYFFHRCAVIQDEFYLGSELKERSSTNPKRLADVSQYQRDSFFAFVMYWMRNTLLGPIEISLWVYKNKGVKDAIKTVSGFYFSYSMYAFLKMQSPIAAFWVFFVSWLVGCFELMFENWSSHIFINPSRGDSNNVWAKNFTCINTNANQKSFNGGYNLLEHIYTGANSLDLIHWSDFPLKMLDNRSQYRSYQTFVFTEISRAGVARLVFLGQLRMLAQKTVDVGQYVGGKSYDEMVKTFEERLRPITFAKKELNGFEAVIDIFKNLFPNDMFVGEDEKKKKSVNEKKVPNNGEVPPAAAATKNGFSIANINFGGGIGDQRDESDIALTYMNKNKNNFDAVFGLKPASPAAMNKKQQLQKENIAAAS